MVSEWFDPADAESTPNRREIHDLTCNGSQGPCWCNEDLDDEIVYPAGEL